MLMAAVALMAISKSHTVNHVVADLQSVTL